MWRVYLRGSLELNVELHCSFFITPSNRFHFCISLSQFPVITGAFSTEMVPARRTTWQQWRQCTVLSGDGEHERTFATAEQVRDPAP